MDKNHSATSSAIAVPLPASSQLSAAVFVPLHAYSASDHWREYRQHPPQR